MLLRRARLLEALAAAITPPVAVPAEPVAPLVALASAGGVLELLAHRLLDDAQAPLSQLHGTIVGLIVLPHGGPEAARRELLRPAPALPVPSPAGDGAAAARRLLHVLQTRLTYRTVRVLDAVAAAPGASNRQIGDAADVADAGQISKLLKRLAGLGLVENSGAGQAKGAVNSWRLTRDGVAIQRAAGGARMLAPRR